MTVASPKDAVEKSYTVNFTFDIVSDKDTKYDIVVAPLQSDPSKNRENVRADSNGKVMTIYADTDLGTIDHEAGHFGGAEDHYTDVNDGTKVRSIPDAGFEGNIMGDPRVIAGLTGGEAMAGIVNAYNIQEMIRAPSSPNRNLSSAVRVNVK